MSWFARCLQRLHELVSEPRRFVVNYVENPPEQLEANGLYLIGNPTRPWAAAFLCPCGCRDRITLSLIDTDSPSWRAYLSVAGDITFNPSIWRTKGCRSHFFIRYGRVVWAREMARVA